MDTAALQIKVSRKHIFNTKKINEQLYRSRYPESISLIQRKEMNGH